MNTLIDKTEIAILLEQTKKNTQIAIDANKPYHDAVACKFINDAIDDYREIYSYIRKTIYENLEVFFKLDNLRIDNWINSRCYSPDKTIVHSFGELFEIGFRLRLGNQKYWYDNCLMGLYANVSADSIYCIDPYIYTSNNEKAERCYSRGYDHDVKKMLLGDVYFDETMLFTAKGWNIWCNKAKDVKKYTEILVREFKSTIKSKLEQARIAVANAVNEATRREAENAIKYEKVKI